MSTKIVGIAKGSDWGVPVAATYAMLAEKFDPPSGVRTHIPRATVGSQGHVEPGLGAVASSDFRLGGRLMFDSPAQDLIFATLFGGETVSTVTGSITERTHTWYPSLWAAGSDGQQRPFLSAGCVSNEGIGLVEVPSFVPSMISISAEPNGDVMFDMSGLGLPARLDDYVQANSESSLAALSLTEAQYCQWRHMYLQINEQDDSALDANVSGDQLIGLTAVKLSIGRKIEPSFTTASGLYAVGSDAPIYNPSETGLPKPGGAECDVKLSWTIDYRDQMAVERLKAAQQGRRLKGILYLIGGNPTGGSGALAQLYMHRFRFPAMTISSASASVDLKQHVSSDQYEAVCTGTVSAPSGMSGLTQPVDHMVRNLNTAVAAW